jgi:hypothetical protein
MPSEWMMKIINDSVIETESWTETKKTFIHEEMYEFYPVSYDKEALYHPIDTTASLN